jgi:predicted NBD/HSP70 family sugar kinase
VVAPGPAARPQLMRAMNEQLVLEHVRAAGDISRADVARISGLAKNTVSFALATLERLSLVRASGVRTGVPGPAAVLYQVNPEAGYVLGLDVGGYYLRGAIADLSGEVRARGSVHTRARSGTGRVKDLAALAATLCGQAGIELAAISQTVVGSPGIYDPATDALTLAAGLPGWEKPIVLHELRRAFGDRVVLENDIDAAALAEQAHGHGRDVDTFAFVSVGTGIGMGLVIDGRLHRGAHGAAGEIGFLPLGDDDTDPDDASRRGRLEAAASAPGIVRAARRAGMQGAVSARRVFQAAARGDERAQSVVAAEAALIAKAICAVIAVADPHLVVLGGGVGQASDFLDQVTANVRRIAPVSPELRVSALGDDAVVDGCLAAGAARLWATLTASLAPVAA